jgi:hypothetical protein
MMQILTASLQQQQAAAVCVAANTTTASATVATIAEPANITVEAGSRNAAAATLVMESLKFVGPAANTTSAMVVDEGPTDVTTTTK